MFLLYIEDGGIPHECSYGHTIAVAADEDQDINNSR